LARSAQGSGALKESRLLEMEKFQVGRSQTRRRFGVRREAERHAALDASTPGLASGLNLSGVMTT